MLVGGFEPEFLFACSSLSFLLVFPSCPGLLSPQYVHKVLYWPPRLRHYCIHGDQARGNTGYVREEQRNVTSRARKRRHREEKENLRLERPQSNRSCTGAFEVTTELIPSPSPIFPFVDELSPSPTLRPVISNLALLVFASHIP
jgi:hypothetical protein